MKNIQKISLLKIADFVPTYTIQCALQIVGLPNEI